jgi:hypothetical protein
MEIICLRIETILGRWPILLTLKNVASYCQRVLRTLIFAGTGLGMFHWRLRCDVPYVSQLSLCCLSTKLSGTTGPYFKPQITFLRAVSDAVTMLV